MTKPITAARLAIGSSAVTAPRLVATPLPALEAEIDREVVPEDRRDGDQRSEVGHGDPRDRDDPPSGSRWSAGSPWRRRAG